jgi:hypothetical protein
MDAADVLYGVSMGGDGVTKVVSRRLPREVAEDGEAAAPPPFAGLDDAPERRVETGLLGEQPAAAAPRRGSAEAA